MQHVYPIKPLGWDQCLSLSLQIKTGDESKFVSKLNSAVAMTGSPVFHGHYCWVTVMEYGHYSPFFNVSPHRAVAKLLKKRDSKNHCGRAPSIATAPFATQYCVDILLPAAIRLMSLAIIHPISVISGQRVYSVYGTALVLPQWITKCSCPIDWTLTSGLPNMNSSLIDGRYCNTNVN